MKYTAFVPINKEGYEPFIDFLKGLSIIFVVLTHCIPFQEKILFSFWGGQAVPFFLLIQVFHYFKKGNYNKVSWKKVLKRIILPFVTMLAISFVCRMVLADDNNQRINIIKTTIINGGIGPGSYYIWIYLQFALLLPLFGKLITILEKRISILQIFIIFALLSESLEIFCSIIDIPEKVYRLSFFRYLFLIPIGYQLVKWGG